jgi:hypothetical protein
MPFDYTVAAAIATYRPVDTERLRDFAHSARQTWDELHLSKRENISLQREIRNLLGEIDVLKSSLLEAEANPQPVVDADALAQEIRRVDGSNGMGAGALAEHIVRWLSAGKENNTHKHTVAILTEKWDDKTVTSAPFCIVCGEPAGKGGE